MKKLTIQRNWQHWVHKPQYEDKQQIVYWTYLAISSEVKRFIYLMIVEAIDSIIELILHI